MTQMVIQQGLISDANVLIDYAKSAPGILQMISQHLQQLYVALPILAEVHDLTTEQVIELGIEIVEPTLEQLAEAHTLRTEKKSISALDALCFVMARDHKWICLTPIFAKCNALTFSHLPTTARLQIIA